MDRGKDRGMDRERDRGSLVGRIYRARGERELQGVLEGWIG
jgi:hypothetical protein